MTPGLATADNQINGEQKVQIVGSSGAVSPAGDVPARAMYVALTDLTSTTAVKAASTPATATDTAAVVDIRPGGLFPAAALGSDAEASSLLTQIGARIRAFNGSSWDRIRSGLVAAQTLFTGILNALPIGVYNSSAPVVANGQGIVLQIDGSGNLKVAEQFADAAFDNANQVCFVGTRPLTGTTGAWTRSASGSGGVGTSGALIKNSGGRVRMVRVTNANTTTGFWLQMHNKASAPVNNDVPVDRVYVPPSATTTTGLVTAVIDYGPDGASFATGISLAASSTCGLLTLLSGTDAHYSILWI